jgi:hypothetical protein
MTARHYSRAAARPTKATPLKRMARPVKYCASRQNADLIGEERLGPASGST